MSNPAHKALGKKISMADIREKAKLRYAKEHGGKSYDSAVKETKAKLHFKKSPDLSSKERADYQKRTGRAYSE